MANEACDYNHDFAKADGETWGRQIGRAGETGMREVRLPSWNCTYGTQEICSLYINETLKIKTVAND